MDYFQSDLYELFLGPKKNRTSKWHHYFPVYDHHFSRFRGKAPTVVEIGVAGGGSLEIWRKYFGADARIIGIDINPTCVQYRGEGTEIIIGDQSDKLFLQDAAKQIGTADIIIDDGGHTAVQTINTFEELFPVVKNLGVYLVEDLQTSLWPQYNDRVDGTTFLDIAKGIAEKLTWWHITPNNMRFKTPPSDRDKNKPPKTPDITRRVWSVSFYDSIVVFEKRDIPEPWNDRR